LKISIVRNGQTFSRTIPDSSTRDEQELALLSLRQHVYNGSELSPKALESLEAQKKEKVRSWGWDQPY